MTQVTNFIKYALLFYPSRNKSRADVISNVLYSTGSFVEGSLYLLDGEVVVDRHEDSMDDHFSVEYIYGSLTEEEQIQYKRVLDNIDLVSTKLQLPCDVAVYNFVKLNCLKNKKSFINNIPRNMSREWQMAFIEYVEVHNAVFMKPFYRTVFSDDTAFKVEKTVAKVRKLPYYKEYKQSRGPLVDIISKIFKR